ncbi:endolytic peptidoglycan transglycosylase RlpA [Serratia sp. M24T3]|uniref:endolytic peptidoglycan transglycosylase RlpA n=1 Tax=Serratia sp. M24T3 TaxID=932213 RepID=UPI00025B8EF1|nr:endolytic peptidoglycan transglycosylase RlpA [Serratia sp. M24T3]EIC84525.1 rare lipoprotein A [Serratia sp. M24T3]
MRKEWVGAIIAGLLLSACSSPDNQPQQAAPEPAYNGPVVEIGGADPVYEPLNANANNDYSANGNSYKIIKDASRFTQTGTATWYGTEAGSNVTASGEEFDPSAMTAAHPTLPIPSYVRVTNMANGRMLVVRINDRGPFTPGKIIDLSQAAFERLNLTTSTRVKLDIINVAPDGTMSGPGTIGTTVAKQTYALPARPSLGATGLGTPTQSAPPAIGAAVRPIDNSTLNTQDDSSGGDSAQGTTAATGGSSFLGAPKPLPSGVLESSEPAAVADDSAADSGSSSTAVAAAAPVVAAPAVTRPATRQSAPVSGGNYMVQVGALSNPQNAELWQKSLSKRFGVPGKVQPNGSTYRVQLGPFTRQQAAQFQQRLSSEAQQQSFVVSASAM